MKKVIALILALCLCLSLAACGEGKGDDPSTKPTESEQTSSVKLPHGLSFGMSYADAKAAYALLPEITPAQANDGYFGSGSSLDFSSIDTVFGLSAETCDLLHSPYQGFSFNEDKELYEYYLLLTPQPAYITNSGKSEEAVAEIAVNELYVTLNNACGKADSESETDSAITMKWDSDSTTVELSLTEDENGKFQISLILHDKTHELK